MAIPTKIQHPLLQSPGTSQRKRMIGEHLLHADFAPIDGRKLGEMLNFVYEHARLVVFHAHRVDANGEEYVELSNWLAFFEKSLPFVINQFTQIDIDQRESDLQRTLDAHAKEPSHTSLRLLLDFCYFDLIKPLDSLQKTVAEAKSAALNGRLEHMVQKTVAEAKLAALSGRLEHIIQTALMPALRRFLELYHITAHYFCPPRYDFIGFSQTPWNIPVEEIFQWDETGVPQKPNEAIEWLGNEIAKITSSFLAVQRSLAAELPRFLPESIDFLEERNEPHLGLLYTFLRLFEHFQGNLNALTQQHLEFFYYNVLKLKRREMTPDQIHVIFEPAKHLPSHFIKEATLFKDAKDSNNVDILFSLDEEVVINRAKVMALKTLFLNPIHGFCQNAEGKCVPKTFVEGIYIAPVANSADGNDKPFQEQQSKNWSSLGAKVSKYTTPESDAPADHLFGRMGFILASPVLWLNEGQREVTITIKCDAAANPDIFSWCVHEYMVNFHESPADSTNRHPFHLAFSGNDGWFEAKGGVRFCLDYSDVTGESNKTITLVFHVRLEKDEPAVAFYNEKVIGEFFAKEQKDNSALKPSLFPMVKIELVPNIKLEYEDNCETNKCCLTRKNTTDSVEVALYYFLRHLRVMDVNIDVKVCGVKNLIVQNEESLQNINSPILPFGIRPKVGAEFYIGNKEVFCKNWKKFWLYFNWKDKPKDLGEHYAFYANEPFEDGSIKISEESFRFKADVLEDGLWKGRNIKSEILFSDSEEENIHCRKLDPYDSFSFYKDFQRDEFHDLEYRSKSLMSEFLNPLNVNSSNGFFRITLDGVSFQHDRYAFVLARKLFELSRLLDPNSIGKIGGNLKDAMELQHSIKGKIDEISKMTGTLVTVINNIDAIANGKENSDNLMLLREKSLALLEQIKTISYPPTETETETETETVRDIPTLDQFDQLLSFLNQEFIKLIDEINKYSIESKGIIGKIDADVKDDPETLDVEGEINQLMMQLESSLIAIKGLLPKTNDDANKEIGLPKEPYTPLIKVLEVDYSALADKNDIEIIHIYPFPRASKTEVLTDKPTLLPTFTDEGTLFIGLENLRPRSNLNLLFQFAEATADSEGERTTTDWHYLMDNQWKPLRPGFELLSDKTEQMTRSGIVKIAVPEDISNNGNTIMPPIKEGQHLFWLKVSAPRAAAGVAELLGVHAQAALATYQPLAGSDLNRVIKPVEPGQVSKTLQPDFGIKQLTQPYPSFGGRQAETNSTIPIRMGELLRHKGRSVDAFDTEHLVLDAFPELFKCKCISHTLGLSAKQYQRDLEVAPGFVVVAVVPDLTKLASGDMLQPMVPKSTLTQVERFLKKRISPFARIRAMNPRYEKVYVRVTVRLRDGRDDTYYTKQLRTDLCHFLAPWYLGDSDKLSFGQRLVYSDIVGFLEGLAYIDYVGDLRLFDVKPPPCEGNTGDVGLTEITPLTARSILTCSPDAIGITLDKKDCSATQGQQPKTTLEPHSIQMKRRNGCK